MADWQALRFHANAIGQLFVALVDEPHRTYQDYYVREQEIQQQQREYAALPTFVRSFVVVITMVLQVWWTLVLICHRSLLFAMLLAASPIFLWVVALTTLVLIQWAYLPQLQPYYQSVVYPIARPLWRLLLLSVTVTGTLLNKSVGADVFVIP